MSLDYTRERRIACLAVRQAALVCQAIQRELAGPALAKQDRSPVTVADFASQALICRILAEAFPEDPVIAEEEAAALRQPEQRGLLAQMVEHVSRVVPGEGPEAWLRWIDHGRTATYCPRFWTLDPIDGTKGFLRGEQYAVSLALIVDGQVVVGALACPNLPVRSGAEVQGGAPGATARGLVSGAVQGQGARQSPGDHPGFEDWDTWQPLRVSTQHDPAQTRWCESVEAGHSAHDVSAELSRRLGVHVPAVRMDSQAKYVAVARGDAELYLRLPTRQDYREKIWDHAAGVLVVEQAGGRVTDVAGRPLDFSCGPTLARNRGVVVSHGPLHARVIELLHELGVGKQES